MPTSAKSMRAAAGLNDLFAKLSWHISDARITSYAADESEAVRIQYRSAAHGITRVVTADPLRLASWIRGESRPGNSRGAILSRFVSLLDRKPDAPTEPLQSELTFDTLDPFARRASNHD